LEIEHKEKYTIVLQSEYKVLRNFSVTHQIHSPEHLQQIAESDLWQRYLSGKAEVVAVIHETNKKLFFTVTKAGRTSVTGEANEFMESVPEVLSLPEQFEEYIKHYSETAKTAFCNRNNYRHHFRVQKINSN
ncbi:MAG: hypothetical protein J7497_14015, partial [Chitinophagaceae bacterium]|nr:hypothetical protein [Chitinophagaceae bacterium]